ncbi:hypothetical protein [Mycobacterium sp. SMC-19]|uniref:hypothetical protein n=1 Tax=Mycobacterium sp. SMC-19 TaxID=3381630 RepID=UPI00387671F4
MGSDGIDDVIEWAESQGWTVTTDANGYRRFYDPAGTYITRYPATPGNARRRRLDVLTKVKKAGLPWPVPNKKELRSVRRKEQEGEG